MNRGLTKGARGHVIPHNGQVPPHMKIVVVKKHSKLLLGFRFTNSITLEAGIELRTHRLAAPYTIQNAKLK